MKAFAVWLLGVVLVPFVALAQAPAANLNTITGVQVNGGTVTITGTQKPNFTTFTMTDPPRLVIDISEAVLSEVPEELQVGNGTVTGIRTASYGSDASSIARVLIGYEREVETEIQAQGNQLVVRVAGGGGQAVAQAPAAEQAPAGNSAADAAAAARAEREAQEKAAADAAAAARAEREAQEKAAADAAAAARAEREAQEKAAAEATSRAEREAQEKAAAEAAAKRDAEAEAKRQEEARAAAQHQQEAQARAEAERKRQQEEQARASERAAEEKRSQEEAARASKQAAEEERRARAQAAAEEQQQKREAAQSAADERRARAQAAAEERRAAAQAAAEERRQRQAETRAAHENRQKPAPASPRAGGAEVSSRRKTLTLVGFQQQAGASRVFVRTNEPVSYSVGDQGRTVVLELENTRVDTSNNTLPLDTSYFASPVLRVDPSASGRDVRITIQLRQATAFQTRQDGNVISLDFQRAGR